MPIYIHILYLLVNFPMQLIAAMLMCTPLYKHKRRYFYLRLPLCLIAYFALAYVFLFTPAADCLVTPNGITFFYLLLALLSMALLFTCFDITVWSIMFYGAFALSIQHIVYNLYTITMVSARLDYYSAMALVLNFLYCAAIYTLAYFLFVRRLIKDESVELNSKSLIIILFLLYIGFVFLNQLIERSRYNLGYRLCTIPKNIRHGEMHIGFGRTTIRKRQKSTFGRISEGISRSRKCLKRLRLKLPATVNINCSSTSNASSSTAALPAVSPIRRITTNSILRHT